MSTSTSIKFNPKNYDIHTPTIVQQAAEHSTRKYISSVPRHASLFGVPNKARIPRLKAPYRQRELNRFEDTFRTDGIVKNAILKKWNFILGARTYVNLDADKEYDSDEERSVAIQAVSNYPPYKKAKDKANEILKNIDFRNVIHAAGVSASVYGRSCIEKVRDESGTIVRLNVLNSKLLGDVEINEDTWQFVGVHYRDLPKTDDLLLSKDIIYITRNDVHISPGSLYYGLSDLEPVIDGSETKRIAKQQDLKEIAKALWAGFIWIMFKNPNVSAADIQDVINKIKPGVPTALEHETELHVEKIAHDSPMLLDIITHMNREALRDLSVPSPLGGYEDVQNFATLQQTLIAWKESDLDAERAWLSSIIEKQVLYEIFREELQKQGINPDQTVPGYSKGEILVKKEMPMPLTSPSSFTKMELPEGLKIGQQYIEPEEQEQNDEYTDPLSNINLPTQTQYEVIPPAKLSFEIEDPNFTPFKEKMETVLGLYDKDLVSARKVLEEADMEDQIEQTELRLHEKQQKLEQMDQFKQNVFENSVLTNNQVQDKKLKLLGDFEMELNKTKNGNGKDDSSSNPVKSLTQFSPSRKTASVSAVDIPNIEDPEIKSLYMEYLKARTRAYENISKD